MDAEDEATRQLDLDARMREREREYRGRVDAMLRLREKAAAGAGSGRPGPHALVSNPFRELSHGEADRVMAAIEEIHVKGYTVFEGLCNAEEVEALRSGLPFDGVARMEDRLGSTRAGAKESPPGDWKLGHDTEYGGRQTKHVHNVLAKSRAADEVAVKPALLSIVAGVIGQNFQLSTHVISNPLPGSDPQGFHQVRTLTHFRAPIHATNSKAADRRLLAG